MQRIAIDQMTYKIEDHWDIIEASTLKHSKLSEEPVRDRIEFSIACEAYLEAERKFDPARIKSEDKASVKFRMFVSRTIRMRITDWIRREAGRHKKKILSVQKTEDFFGTLKSKENPIESLELADAVCSLPPVEFNVVMEVFRNGSIPNGKYKQWRSAKERLLVKLT